MQVFHNNIKARAFPITPLPHTQLFSARRILSILMVLGTFLASAGEVCWADFEKGWNSFEEGDFATALREWTVGAEQGNAMAQLSLGFMFHVGQGVPQNYVVALRWYTKAAEQKLPEAQYILGLMHHNGLGVIQNDVKAHMWANIASSNGARKGIKLKAKTAERLTVSQLAEAQELARDCARKDYKGC